MVMNSQNLNRKSSRFQGDHHYNSFSENVVQNSTKYLLKHFQYKFISIIDFLIISSFQITKRKCKILCVHLRQIIIDNTFLII